MAPRRIQRRGWGVKVETKFNILDRVRIIEIGSPATVLKVQFHGIGILYQLEYWMNGEIKTVWLYEGELKAMAGQHFDIVFPEGD